MLSIFAEAMLIATRLGTLPEENLNRETKRRGPREFQEIDGLSTNDTLRNQGR